jgi:hypothetical protein
MGEHRPVPLHLSASSSVLILTTIIDGPTNATWDFRSAQLHRGSVDVALGDGTALGITVGFARAEAAFTRRNAIFTQTNCQVTCDVELDYFSAAVSLHVGDKPGFHPILSTSIGMHSMANFREMNSGDEVGPESADLDVAFSAGFGVGYSLHRRLQVILVQDVGFSVHTKSGSVLSPSNALQPLLALRFGLRAGLGK